MDFDSGSGVGGAATGGGRSRRGRASAPVVPLGRLAADGLATGMVLAGVSLAVMAVLVRVAGGPRSGAGAVVLITAGAAAGVWVGGWLLQPRLSRRWAGRRGRAGDYDPS